VKRPATGAAIGACLAACVAIAAGTVGAFWARPSAAGFEGFVSHITRHRLSEALFVTTSFLAAGLGICALIQIARDRRRRGVVTALVGIISPWLARAIFDVVLGGL